jgi:hypothetical protein
MDKFDDSHNPVPVVLSVLAEIADSDEIIAITEKSGISIDLTLKIDENYSNKTRIRAYLPRLTKVYQSADTEKALHAISTTAQSIIQHYPEKLKEINDRLNRIGWAYIDNEVQPTTDDVTEQYFKKGMVHTAYSQIRKIILTAQDKVIIVDQYVDGTIFELLKNLNPERSFDVFIITDTSKHSDFEHEKNLFCKEHANLNIAMYNSIDFHDRFIIIDDERLFHLGASIKDAGKKSFMINEIVTDNIRVRIISDIKTVISKR